MRRPGHIDMPRRVRSWLAIACVAGLAFMIVGGGHAGVVEPADGAGFKVPKPPKLPKPPEGFDNIKNSLEDIKKAHEDLKEAYGVAKKAFEDITPKQEYYIGRAVAADILLKYPALDDPVANEYLNTLGQTVARFSDRPETYKGYHFLLLDSDEINAFAAPGGLIMVTRGLARLCRSEDALAAVLAHEIGHVALAHGLSAIGTSRRTDLIVFAATEGATLLGDEDLKKHVDRFGGTVKDVTKQLVEKGYDRKREHEADTSATETLARVGYNPTALVDMLNEMQKSWKKGGLGFMKTHPSPSDRIKKVEPLVKDCGPVAEPTGRHARFVAAMGAL